MTLLEKGAASWTDLEICVESQVLRGGDLATTLVDSGVLDEGPTAELYAGHLGLPCGPLGKLVEPSPHVSDLLPPELAARHHLYPLGRTQHAIEVAVGDAVDPDVVEMLAAESGLEVTLLAVLPHRLAEALASYAGLPISERERWLVGLLNAGELPTVEASEEGMRRRAARAFPAAAPYRRMSLHPEGLVPSERQAAPATSQSPSTLDGVGGEEASPESTQHKRTLDPADSQHDYTSEPPSSVDDPGRITRPYAEPEGEEGEKRDTQPWRDDDPDDAPPVSVSGEFKASLSEAPPSAEARILEEHRRFRHRGPFTRPQAELAASQAPDVHMVLEILTRYARQFFERSILFVVSAETAELRFSHGLSMSLALLTVNLEEEQSVLRDAFLSGDPVVRPLERDGVDAILRNKLSIVGEERVTAIPLTIRERVVAIFYGDDRSDGVDRDAVADVTDFIEICAGEITRIIISRKRNDLDL
jgi:hypothetical protein